MQNKNRSIYYEDTCTSKTPLIFLHYFGGSSQTWQFVLPYLQDNYRLIAPDLTGFGLSSKPTHVQTVEGHANEVLELIKELKLDNYIIIGHSMGGKIALAVAAKKPGGLKNVILAAPSPPSPEPVTEEDRENLRLAFGNKTLLEKNIQNITKAPLSKQITEALVNTNLLASKTAWDGWLDAGSREDISDDMKNIHVPVHVIAAANDKNLSPQVLQKTVVDKLHNATLFIIKNCGHLIPIEKPKELAVLIKILPK